MSDQMLQQILQEVINVNKRFDSLERELKEMRSEYNEFREETRAQQKILQEGQKGLRNEITERFNETKEKMDNIELDLKYTYHKVSENELKLNRLSQHPST